VNSTNSTTSERYVGQRELAELMGVSLSTVKRWTRQGMPNESWGLRVRRYLPSVALAWAQARAESTLAPPNHPPAPRLMSAGASNREE
jgi:hypothetical protein